MSRARILNLLTDPQRIMALRGMALLSTQA